GGNSGEPEPDPIPNSAVKLSCANGTKSRRLGRVGRCQACQGQETDISSQGGFAQVLFTIRKYEEFTGPESMSIPAFFFADHAAPSSCRPAARTPTCR